MKIVNISDFQINCLHFLDEVAKTGESFLITKNGVPMTQLSPYHDNKPKTLFGALKGTITVHGDIISPIEVKWNVLQ